MTLPCFCTVSGPKRRSKSYFEVCLGNASTSDCNLEVFSELLATAELEDVPETNQPQEITEVSTSVTSQEVLPNDNPVGAQWEPQEVSEDSSDANPNKGRSISQANIKVDVGPLL